MMRSEPREEDSSVNMVMSNGATTGGDVRKQPGEDVKAHNAPTNEPDFEMEHEKGMSKEAKKSFTKASTLGSRDLVELGMDPSMLATFLETCMKLLRDNKEVKGLQELITRCTGSGEPCMVWKLGKHDLRTRREMRMTAQIGEYEMDLVILDLGSDVNVFPEQPWERMGRHTLQWSPIQLWMANQQKILPMGRLQGVTVDIEGISMQTNFEVIEIVDHNNPYPALLRID